MNHDKLAEAVRISWDDGVTIDGVRLPFYVGEDIGVTPGGRDDLTVVHLPLLVWGTVTLVDKGGKRRMFDRELGEVAAYARDLVRKGLLERVPWLDAEYVAVEEASR